ncbi:cystathionine gamma-synthase [Rhodothalassium salexigens DSM 2132]|uniref:Cystathionine gamma-synthase n=1 Tax=Rhodothalassium salexigens DSM 2132 TaxID=1188247 RepID=A0A4R2PR50_RHOSA|nr:PLP-dependent transferase [Rhodothalassium salexigens]MBB4210158.1 cystathionine gamma-synthase [Rhodothalassium salexigens DSM 2132]MBK1639315.1 cystathionine gamma-synthase [Rhodothalassium salexigens DSM 2132]TCP38322.1 cystathionine gamma-synthase [Rhodothalassium salexigens DSM 2132]
MTDDLRAPGVPPATDTAATGTPATDTSAASHRPAAGHGGAARDGWSGRTRAINTGIARDPGFGAVVPPLHLSSNYRFTEWGTVPDYDYARSGGPTTAVLAETLAALEGGAGAAVTASGMAAITLLLAPLPAGARVAVPHDCYGGTYRLMEAKRRRGHLDVVYIDQTRADAGQLGAGVDLIFLETPSNPLMRLADIAAWAEVAQTVGAALAVDNTFLSPALQRPLAHGADHVVHSTTKYINGHSDVIGGALISADAAAAEDYAWWANCLGLTGGAFDGYLTLRGVRTLYARLAQAQASAEALAAWLAQHPAVARVHYPGLPDHPDAALVRRQQAGPGAMISIDLAGGLAAARLVGTSVRLFTLAESLGGVESLIAHPATMTHRAMDAEARARAGLSDGLLRLSIGLEAEADLRADLDQALAAAA